MKLKSVSKFSFFTMISRVLGFARDVVLAHVFGAGVSLDAFLVAFKLPNFFRRLFAEGAFTQAFVPILTEVEHERQGEEAWLFVRQVMTLLFVITATISLALSLGAPYVIKVFAPGFDPNGERYFLASHMLQVTSVYLSFMSLSALASALLNIRERFTASALVPAVLNIFMILAAYHASEWNAAYPVFALASAVFWAGLIQWFVLLCCAMKTWGQYLLPCWGVWNPALTRLSRMILAGLYGVSLVQLGLVIDTWLASFLSIGSLSWLYYADRLINLPLGVFGVAIVTVSMPSLSKYAVERDIGAFEACLGWSSALMLFIALPAMIGLLVLAKPICFTLFFRGAFGVHDVMMSAYAIQAMSIGLPAYMLIKMLASVFYSKQEVRHTVIATSIGLAVNILMNIILMRFWGHIGLALSMAMAAWVNVAVLAVGLKKRGWFHFQPAWFGRVARLSLASLMMGGVLFVCSPGDHVWLVWSFKFRVYALLSLISLGLTVYIVALYALRLPWYTFRSMRSWSSNLSGNLKYDVSSA